MKKNKRQCNKDCNIYNAALNKIIKDTSLSNKITLLGPTGPRGVADSIKIGKVDTGEPGTQAMIIDNNQNNCHVLDFVIPRGMDGIQGPAGTSISVLGTYDNYDDFIKEHAIGNKNDAYLINGDLYLWSDNENKWENAGRIQGPTGPMGPAGTTTFYSAYLVTFNETGNPVKISSNEVIPIKRVELDIGDIVIIDENVIKFNLIGYYQINILISAFTNASEPFDANKDFVTIGLKLNDTDNIYVGASSWIYNNNVTQVKAQGIIAVDDTTNTYKLVNLSKNDIYLNTPDLINISSISYFTNPIVTIIINYLGK